MCFSHHLTDNRGSRDAFLFVLFFGKYRRDGFFGSWNENVFFGMYDGLSFPKMADSQQDEKNSSSI